MDQNYLDNLEEKALEQFKSGSRFLEKMERLLHY